MEGTGNTSSPLPEIPAIALGTVNSETFEDSLRTAVRVGYRHIDTASLYNNEEKIGRVLSEFIANGTHTRADFFITTKVYNNEKFDVEGALRASLKRLRTDYVDLYLMHWPGGYFDENGTYRVRATADVWRDMEALVEKGLARRIGVSNFNVQSITDLIAYAKIRPAVNQVELHPYLQQTGLVKCCALFGIKIMAYSPLCRGGKREKDGAIVDVFKDEVIQAIAKKHGRSEAQVTLKWLLQRGIYVVPRSENENRLRDNLAAGDDSWALDAEDIAAIDSLEKNCRMVLSEAKMGLDYFA